MGANGVLPEIAEDEFTNSVISWCAEHKRNLYTPPHYSTSTPGPLSGGWGEENT